MKTIHLIYLLAILSISSCARMVYPVPSPRTTMSGTISATGHSADDIYAAAELWFAKSYIDSRAVLEVRNKESHILYGKPIHIYNKDEHCNYIWQYTIEIRCKNDKLYYEIANIIHDQVICENSSQKVRYYYEYQKAHGYLGRWQKMKDDLDTSIKLSIVSLESEIKNFNKSF